MKKTRIGSKIKRVMSKPLTPYARLVTDANVSNERRQALADEHLSLNPFSLRKALRRKLRDFRLYVGKSATPGKYAL